jgi:tRNA nucleotidyltransferase (CCA-adding enzyme)
MQTIEERINEVLDEKRELFEVILSQAHGTQKTGMSQKDIFGLFNLKAPKKKAA